MFLLPNITCEHLRLAGIFTNDRCGEDDLDVSMLPVSGSERLRLLKARSLGEALTSSNCPIAQNSCCGKHDSTSIGIEDSGNYGVINADRFGSIVPSAQDAPLPR